MITPAQSAQAFHEAVTWTSTSIIVPPVIPPEPIQPLARYPSWLRPPSFYEASRPVTRQPSARQPKAKKQTPKTPKPVVDESPIITIEKPRRRIG